MLFSVICLQQIPTLNNEQEYVLAINKIVFAISNKKTKTSELLLTKLQRILKL